MIEDFAELARSLLRAPGRTALTGLAVAWGVFVLVLLLGAGDGLQKQMAWDFRDDAVNSLWLYPRRTSKPWNGLPVGRPITLTNDDHQLVVDEVDQAEHVAARFMVWGDTTLRWKDRAASFEIRSVHPDHRFLEGTEMVAGRWLQEGDLEAKAKVIVIGQEVQTSLFRGADPLGEWVSLKGVAFRVVGVFTDVGGMSELQKVYLPITTAQAAFGGTDTIHRLLFTVGDATVDEALVIEDEVRRMLAATHGFDPNDTRAVRVRNNVERFDRTMAVFGWLELFVWIVGAGTVAAGVVGVSNILLVSVAERTTEIGLRKALGATPWAIVAPIVAEALLMVAIAGQLGLLAGVVVVELTAAWLPDNDYLRDPAVAPGAVLAALGLLVVAGAVSGFVPAWRAASVQPVVALRGGG